MAITYDGKVYRNLEEQVQANKNNIERIIEGEELLARLGIKIVGRVDGNADLPNPVTYPGEYGDAYLVGTTMPYDYFIFTRPFQGETDPQWFDLGPFPVAGPQGPVGPQGPKGADGVRGSQWFSGTGQPATTSGYNVGDYYINVGTGNIWHLHDVDGAPRWLLEGNIRGPQGPVGPQGTQGPEGPIGPQGPQGPQGTTGTPVTIRGIITSIDELPNPDHVQSLNDAYLYQHDGIMELFVIAFNSAYNPYWINTGLFSGGTQILVNGVPVTTYSPPKLYRHNIIVKLINTNWNIELQGVIYLRTQTEIFNDRTVISQELWDTFIRSASTRWFEYLPTGKLIGPAYIGSTSNMNIYFRIPDSYNNDGTFNAREVAFYNGNYLVTQYQITEI